MTDVVLLAELSQEAMSTFIWCAFAVGALLAIRDVLSKK